MPKVTPKIPQGLEELMLNLAKSIIKENPQNMYEFAAEYFEKLIRERDGKVDESYKKLPTYKAYINTKNKQKKTIEKQDSAESSNSTQKNSKKQEKVATIGPVIGNFLQEKIIGTGIRLQSGRVSRLSGRIRGNSKNSLSSDSVEAEKAESLVENTEKELKKSKEGDLDSESCEKELRNDHLENNDEKISLEQKSKAEIEKELLTGENNAEQSEIVPQNVKLDVKNTEICGLDEDDLNNTKNSLKVQENIENESKSVEFTDDNQEKSELVDENITESQEFGLNLLSKIKENDELVVQKTLISEAKENDNLESAEKFGKEIDDYINQFVEKDQISESQNDDPERFVDQKNIEHFDQNGGNDAMEETVKEKSGLYDEKTPVKITKIIEEISKSEDFEDSTSKTGSIVDENQSNNLFTTQISSQDPHSLKPPTEIATKILETSATKIQSTFRGYKVRKHLKSETIMKPNEDFIECSTVDVHYLNRENNNEEITEFTNKIDKSGHDGDEKFTDSKISSNEENENELNENKLMNISGGMEANVGDEYVVDIDGNGEENSDGFRKSCVDEKGNNLDDFEISNNKVDENDEMKETGVEKFDTKTKDSETNLDISEKEDKICEARADSKELNNEEFETKIDENFAINPENNGKGDQVSATALKVNDKVDKISDKKENEFSEMDLNSQEISVNSELDYKTLDEPQEFGSNLLSKIKENDDIVVKKVLESDGQEEDNQESAEKFGKEIDDYINRFIERSEGTPDEIVQKLDNSVTKIQSTFRGYKTRKELKENNNKNESNANIENSVKNENVLDNVEKSIDNKTTEIEKFLEDTKNIVSSEISEASDLAKDIETNIEKNIQSKIEKVKNNSENIQDFIQNEFSGAPQLVKPDKLSNKTDEFIDYESRDPNSSVPNEVPSNEYADLSFEHEDSLTGQGDKINLQVTEAEIHDSRDGVKESVFQRVKRNLTEKFQGGVENLKTFGTERVDDLEKITQEYLIEVQSERLGEENSQVNVEKNENKEFKEIDGLKIIEVIEKVDENLAKSNSEMNNENEEKSIDVDGNNAGDDQEKLSEINDEEIDKSPSDSEKASDKNINKKSSEAKDSTKTAEKMTLNEITLDKSSEISDQNDQLLEPITVNSDSSEETFVIIENFQQEIAKGSPVVNDLDNISANEADDNSMSENIVETVHEKIEKFKGLLFKRSLSPAPVKDDENTETNPSESFRADDHENVSKISEKIEENFAQNMSNSADTDTNTSDGLTSTGETEKTFENENKKAKFERNEQQPENNSYDSNLQENNFANYGKDESLQDEKNLKFLKSPKEQQMFGSDLFSKIKQNDNEVVAKSENIILDNEDPQAVSKLGREIDEYLSKFIEKSDHVEENFVSSEGIEMLKNSSKTSEDLDIDSRATTAEVQDEEFDFKDFKNIAKLDEKSTKTEKLVLDPSFDNEDKSSANLQKMNEVPMKKSEILLETPPDQLDASQITVDISSKTDDILAESIANTSKSDNITTENSISATKTLLENLLSPTSSSFNPSNITHDNLITSDSLPSVTDEKYARNVAQGNENKISTQNDIELNQENANEFATGSGEISEIERTEKESGIISGGEKLGKYGNEEGDDDKNEIKEKFVRKIDDEIVDGKENLEGRNIADSNDLNAVEGKDSSDVQISIDESEKNYIKDLDKTIKNDQKSIDKMIKSDLEEALKDQQIIKDIQKLNESAEIAQNLADLMKEINSREENMDDEDVAKKIAEIFDGTIEIVNSSEENIDNERNFNSENVNPFENIENDKENMESSDLLLGFGSILTEKAKQNTDSTEAKTTTVKNTLNLPSINKNEEDDNNIKETATDKSSSPNAQNAKNRSLEYDLNDNKQFMMDLQKLNESSETAQNLADLMKEVNSCEENVDVEDVARKIAEIFDGSIEIINNSDKKIDNDEKINSKSVNTSEKIEDFEENLNDSNLLQDFGLILSEKVKQNSGNAVEALTVVESSDGDLKLSNNDFENDTECVETDEAYNPNIQEAKNQFLRYDLVNNEQFMKDIQKLNESAETAQNLADLMEKVNSLDENVNAEDVARKIADIFDGTIEIINNSDKNIDNDGNFSLENVDPSTKIEDTEIMENSDLFQGFGKVLIEKVNQNSENLDLETTTVIKNTLDLSDPEINKIETDQNIKEIEIIEAINPDSRNTKNESKLEEETSFADDFEPDSLDHSELEIHEGGLNDVDDFVNDATTQKVVTPLNEINTQENDTSSTNSVEENEKKLDNGKESQKNTKDIENIEKNLDELCKTPKKFENNEVDKSDLKEPSNDKLSAKFVKDSEELKNEFSTKELNKLDHSESPKSENIEGVVHEKIDMFKSKIRNKRDSGAIGHVEGDKILEKEHELDENKDFKDFPGDQLEDIEEFSIPTKVLSETSNKVPTNDTETKENFNKNDENFEESVLIKKIEKCSQDNQNKEEIASKIEFNSDTLTEPSQFKIDSSDSDENLQGNSSQINTNAEVLNDPPNFGSNLLSKIKENDDFVVQNLIDSDGQEDRKNIESAEKFGKEIDEYINQFIEKPKQQISTSESGDKLELLDHNQQIPAQENFDVQEREAQVNQNTNDGIDEVDFSSQLSKNLEDVNPSNHNKTETIQNSSTILSHVNQNPKDIDTSNNSTQIVPKNTQNNTDSQQNTSTSTQVTQYPLDETKSNDTTFNEVNKISDDSSSNENLGNSIDEKIVDSDENGKICSFDYETLPSPPIDSPNDDENVNKNAQIFDKYLDIYEEDLENFEYFSNNPEGNLKKTRKILKNLNEITDGEVKDENKSDGQIEALQGEHLKNENYEGNKTEDNVGTEGSKVENLEDSNKTLAESNKNLEKTEIISANFSEEKENFKEKSVESHQIVSTFDVNFENSGEKFDKSEAFDGSSETLTENTTGLETGEDDIKIFSDSIEKVEKVNDNLETASKKFSSIDDNSVSISKNTEKTGNLANQSDENSFNENNTDDKVISSFDTINQDNAEFSQNSHSNHENLPEILENPPISTKSSNIKYKRLLTTETSEDLSKSSESLDDSSRNSDIKSKSSNDSSFEFLDKSPKGSAKSRVTDYEEKLEGKLENFDENLTNSEAHHDTLKNPQNFTEDSPANKSEQLSTNDNNKESLNKHEQTAVTHDDNREPVKEDKCVEKIITYCGPNLEQNVNEFTKSGEISIQQKERDDENLGGEMESNEKQQKHFNQQEQNAAIKIQSTYRGYKIRKPNVNELHNIENRSNEKQENVNSGGKLLKEASVKNFEIGYAEKYDKDNMTSNSKDMEKINKSSDLVEKSTLKLNDVENFETEIDENPSKNDNFDQKSQNVNLKKEFLLKDEQNATISKVSLESDSQDKLQQPVKLTNTNQDDSNSEILPQTLSENLTVPSKNIAKIKTPANTPPNSPTLTTEPSKNFKIDIQKSESLGSMKSFETPTLLSPIIHDENLARRQSFIDDMILALEGSDVIEAGCMSYGDGINSLSEEIGNKIEDLRGDNKDDDDGNEKIQENKSKSLENIENLSSDPFGEKVEREEISNKELKSIDESNDVITQRLENNFEILPKIDESISESSQNSQDSTESPSKSQPYPEKLTKPIDHIHQAPEASVHQKFIPVATVHPQSHKPLSPKNEIPAGRTSYQAKYPRLTMMRQNTMPVQIESNVMRIIPKHLRKRIKSAEGDKKKRRPNMK